MDPSQLVNTFSPVESLVGGVFVGLACWAMLALNGEILGISGIVRNVVMGGEQRWWRIVFMLGLELAAAVFFHLNNDGKKVAVRPSPDYPYCWFLYLTAGFLVGFGSQLGGGCTSGHMICGLARISKRSIVATSMFMLGGFAIVTGTGIDPAEWPIHVVWPSAARIGALVGIFVSSMAFYLGLLKFVPSLNPSVPTCSIDPNAPDACNPSATPASGIDSSSSFSVSRKKKLLKVLYYLVVFVSGMLFLFGIAFGGMLDQTRVLGFLCLRKWNPSLMCVAAGALIPAVILFQRHALKMECPAVGDHFSLPKLTKITPRLVAGSLMFGVGWGITGLCPGPAFGLILFSFDWYFLLWLVGMAAGMASFIVCDLLEKRATAKPEQGLCTIAGYVNGALSPKATQRIMCQSNLSIPDPNPAVGFAAARPIPEKSNKAQDGGLSDGSMYEPGPDIIQQYQSASSFTMGISQSVPVPQPPTIDNTALELFLAPDQIGDITPKPLFSISYMGAAAGVGVIFGFCLAAIQLHSSTVIAEQFTFEDFTVMKFMISAVGTSSVVNVVMSSIERFQPSLRLSRSARFFVRAGTDGSCPAPAGNSMGGGGGCCGGAPRGVVATILGSALIGMGLSIGGLCPATMFVQIGGGAVNGLVAVAFGLLAALFGGLLAPSIQKFLSFGQLRYGTLDALFKTRYRTLGLPLAVACTAAVIGLEIKFPSPYHSLGWRWPPYSSGILVGLLQVPAIMAMGLSLSSSDCFFVTVANALQCGGLRADLHPEFGKYVKTLSVWWNPIFLLCAMYGSCLWGVLSFNLGDVPTRSAFESGLSGFLVIFGAWMAGGCTSGHGLSGTAQLSIQSLIALVSIFASAVITVYVRRTIV